MASASSIRSNVTPLPLRKAICPSGSSFGFPSLFCWSISKPAHLVVLRLAMPDSAAYESSADMILPMRPMITFLLSASASA